MIFYKFRVKTKDEKTSYNFVKWATDDVTMRGIIKEVMLKFDSPYYQVYYTTIEEGELPNIKMEYLKDNSFAEVLELARLAKLRMFNGAVIEGDK